MSYPITIRLDGVAVTIMTSVSEENSLYVKCTDYIGERADGGGRPAKSLEQAYQIAAELLKNRLKEHVEMRVDRTISDHRKLVAEAEASSQRR